MADRPTAASTAVLYDGRSAELLVAYSEGDRGVLHTLQFEEIRADRGEVERLPEFDWSRTALVDAALVIPESGQLLSRLNEYWLMWRNESGLVGQSARHSRPLISALPDEEWTIDRPIVAGNRELHVYGWRGGLLVRHRFTDTVTVEHVLELAARPARSICAPLPGDDRGTGFIGIVNDNDGCIEATAIFARGQKVMQFDGQAAGRYRLMGRHRMGAHVGRKMRPALAVMTESLDDGSYCLLEARFDFGKKECVWKRTKLEFIPAGDLLTASVFYYKTQDAPDPFVMAVNRAGRLILPRRRNVVVIKEDAGAGYGYPILTTMTNRYEATGVGNDIKLEKF